MLLHEYLLAVDDIHTLLAHIAHAYALQGIYTTHCVSLILHLYGCDARGISLTLLKREGTSAFGGGNC